MRAAGVVYFLGFCAIVALGVWGGHHALLRVERAHAQRCAAASDGSRAAIVDCFNKFGVSR